MRATAGLGSPRADRAGEAKAVISVISMPSVLGPAAWLIAAALCGPAAAAGDAVSEAETALFLTDHLSKIKAPAVLRYGFSRRGHLDTAFEDTIEVSVAA